MSTFEIMCWVGLVVWAAFALTVVLGGIQSKHACCSESDVLVAEADEAQLRAEAAAA